MPAEINHFFVPLLIKSLPFKIKNDLFVFVQFQIGIKRSAALADEASDLGRPARFEEHLHIHLGDDTVADEAVNGKFAPILIAAATGTRFIADNVLAADGAFPWVA